MWDVTNHTPFAALGYFLRDKSGAEHWVVAVRASFDVPSRGHCDIASAQTPVRLVPAYADDQAAEMLEDSDLQPFRPLTDVVLHGTATAPQARPQGVIPVTLRLGKIDKTLHCTGPRTAIRNRFSYSLSDPEPISALSLGWAHSLGGPSARPSDDAAPAPVNAGNPLGKGWIEDWSRLERGAELAMAQIFDPADPIAPGRPFPEPQGFGSLQPHWLARLKHAGTFDAEWQARRHPRLPLDHDDRFSQAVLPDQTAALVGGETVEVLNVRPEGPWVFRLPQIVFSARTRIGAQVHDTRFRLVSVVLDAAASTVAMVWNTSVPCNGGDTLLRGSSVRVRQMSGVAT